MSNNEPDREVLIPEIVGAEPPHQTPSFDPTQTYVGGSVSGEGSAILALSLAISSWFVLPFVGAVAALAIAPSAKRRARQVNGSTSLATAAQVIAVLNIAACVFLLWAFVWLLNYLF